MYTKELLNKRTEEMEMHGFCDGIIKVVGAPRKNESTKKVYYPFDATLTDDNGKEHEVKGQVYDAYLPFVGGLEVIKAGYKGTFRSKLSDLKSGSNAYWSVSGSTTDSPDEILNMFENL